MHPILLNLPGGLLKALALVGTFGGLLLTVLAYGLGGKLKERWLSWGISGLIGGLVLARVMSGGWPLTPAAWKAEWTGLPIYSYGVLLGLSLFIGWYVAIAMAVRDGLNQGEIATCYLVTAISAVVCSRLLYVITQWDEFDGRVLDMVNFRRGGLVAYGGFLGGLLGSAVYCRLKRISLLLWADSAVLAISLGTSITRVGCLMYGCDYGKTAPTLPWGIRFPQGSPAYHDHLRLKLIEATAMWSEKVHPTQIYESLVGLSAFLMLLLVRRYRQFAGQVFLTFAVYYGVLRYTIELYRGDEDRANVGFFSTSQFIGVVTVSLAILTYVLLYRRYRANPEASRPWVALLAARAAAVAEAGEGGSVTDGELAEASRAAGGGGGRSSAEEPRPAGARKAKKGRRR
jgi:phosphatidylglycerol:prolipoprotein diacylglycerol transferase